MASRQPLTKLLLPVVFITFTLSFQQWPPAQYQEHLQNSLSSEVGASATNTTTGMASDGNQGSDPQNTGGSTGDNTRGSDCGDNSGRKTPIKECIGLKDATASQLALVTEKCSGTCKPGEEKITICHRTSSILFGYVTVTISMSALASHLNEHDDYLGACRSPREAQCVPHGGPHSTTNEHCNRD